MVKCPWCKTDLCNHQYEDALPDKVEALEATEECPSCAKILKVERPASLCKTTARPSRNPCPLSLIETCWRTET